MCRLLIIEVNELRASKEVGGSESGSSLNRSTSSSIRHGMRAVLGLKKNKDKHSTQQADRCAALCSPTDMQASLLLLDLLGLTHLDLANLSQDAMLALWLTSP